MRQALLSGNQLLVPTLGKAAVVGELHARHEQRILSLDNETKYNKVNDLCKPR